MFNSLFSVFTLAEVVMPFFVIGTISFSTISFAYCFLTKAPISDFRPVTLFNNLFTLSCGLTFFNYYYLRFCVDIYFTNLDNSIFLCVCFYFKMAYSHFTSAEHMDMILWRMSTKWGSHITNIPNQVR